MDNDAFGLVPAAEQMRQTYPMDEATIKQVIDRRKSDIRTHEVFKPIMQSLNMRSVG